MAKPASDAEVPQSVHAERSRSLWEPLPSVDAEALRDSRPGDVVVIGSGIAGLSIAYEALLRGREVMVLDRGPIAGGTRE